MFDDTNTELMLLLFWHFLIFISLHFATYHHRHHIGLFIFLFPFQFQRIFISNYLVSFCLAIAYFLARAELYSYVLHANRLFVWEGREGEETFIKLSHFYTYAREKSCRKKYKINYTHIHWRAHSAYIARHPCINPLCE